MTPTPRPKPTVTADILRGFVPPGLPDHLRNAWTRDETHLSPSGSHFLTLYAINEETMGHVTCRAAWGRVDAPADYTALARLPLAPVHHWLSDTRLALKLHAYHRDWVRAVVLIDMVRGMALVPHSSGPDFIPTDLSDDTFQPFNEIALAMELDLTHLV